jgi:hypothetical protein
VESRLTVGNRVLVQVVAVLWHCVSQRARERCNRVHTKSLSGGVCSKSRRSGALNLSARVRVRADVRVEGAMRVGNPRRVGGGRRNRERSRLRVQTMRAREVLMTVGRSRS